MKLKHAAWLLAALFTNTCMAGAPLFDACVSLRERPDYHRLAAELKRTGAPISAA